MMLQYATFFIIRYVNNLFHAENTDIIEEIVECEYDLVDQNIECKYLKEHITHK